jgi:hypothetical protein
LYCIIYADVNKAPYTFKWDTTAVSNGPHIVTARALEASQSTLNEQVLEMGLSGDAKDSVTMMVSNPPR